MMYKESTRQKIIDELQKDFMKELSKIDFSNYSPDSKVFMYPLSIGLLTMLLKDIDGDSDIQEEIAGAEKYLDMYEKTSDNAYQTMASDELKHAKMLIGLSKVKHPGVDMSEYEEAIHEISEKL